MSYGDSKHSKKTILNKKGTITQSDAYVKFLTQLESISKKLTDLKQALDDSKTVDGRREIFNKNKKAIQEDMSAYTGTYESMKERTLEDGNFSRAIYFFNRTIINTHVFGSISTRISSEITKILKTIDAYCTEINGFVNPESIKTEKELGGHNKAESKAQELEMVEEINEITEPDDEEEQPEEVEVKQEAKVEVEERNPPASVVGAAPEVRAPAPPPEPAPVIPEVKVEVKPDIEEEKVEVVNPGPVIPSPVNSSSTVWGVLSNAGSWIRSWNNAPAAVFSIARTARDYFRGPDPELLTNEQRNAINQQADQLTRDIENARDLARMYAAMLPADKKVQSLEKQFNQKIREAENAIAKTRRDQVAPRAPAVEQRELEEAKRCGAAVQAQAVELALQVSTSPEQKVVAVDIDATWPASYAKRTLFPEVKGAGYQPPERKHKQTANEKKAELLQFLENSDAKTGAKIYREKIVTELKAGAEIVQLQHAVRLLNYGASLQLIALLSHPGLGNVSSKILAGDGTISEEEKNKMRFQAVRRIEVFAGILTKKAAAKVALEMMCETLRIELPAAENERNNLEQRVLALLPEAPVNPESGLFDPALPDIEKYSKKLQLVTAAMQVVTEYFTQKYDDAFKTRSGALFARLLQQVEGVAKGQVDQKYQPKEWLIEIGKALRSKPHDGIASGGGIVIPGAAPAITPATRHERNNQQFRERVLDFSLELINQRQFGFDDIRNAAFGDEKETENCLTNLSNKFSDKLEEAKNLSFEKLRAMFADVQAANDKITDFINPLTRKPFRDDPDVRRNWGQQALHVCVARNSIKLLVSGVSLENIENFLSYKTANTPLKSIKNTSDKMKELLTTHPINDVEFKDLIKVMQTFQAYSANDPRRELYNDLYQTVKSDQARINLLRAGVRLGSLGVLDEGFASWKNVVNLLQLDTTPRELKDAIMAAIPEDEKYFLLLPLLEKASSANGEFKAAHYARFIALPRSEQIKLLRRCMVNSPVQLFVEQNDPAEITVLARYVIGVLPVATSYSSAQATAEVKAHAFETQFNDLRRSIEGALTVNALVQPVRRLLDMQESQAAHAGQPLASPELLAALKRLYSSTVMVGNEPVPFETLLRDKVLLKAKAESLWQQVATEQLRLESLYNALSFIDRLKGTPEATSLKEKQAWLRDKSAQIKEFCELFKTSGAQAHDYFERFAVKLVEFKEVKSEELTRNTAYTGSGSVTKVGDEIKFGQNPSWRFWKRNEVKGSMTLRVEIKNQMPVISIAALSDENKRALKNASDSELYTIGLVTINQYLEALLKEKDEAVRAGELTALLQRKIYVKDLEAGNPARKSVVYMLAVFYSLGLQVQSTAMEAEARKLVEEGKVRNHYQKNAEFKQAFDKLAQIIHGGVEPRKAAEAFNNIFRLKPPGSD